MRKILLLFLLFGTLVLYGKEKFTIGRDPGWTPLQLGDKTPYINAFVEALVQQIGIAEGVDFELFKADFVYLFQGLEEKWYQGVLDAVNPNTETQGYFDFSDPLLLLGPVLIVTKQSKITSLQELEKGAVGISPFDHSVLIVQQYPTIIIKNYDNMPTALEDLSSGKIDGVLLRSIEAKYLLDNGFGDKLKIASEPLNQEAIRLIVLQGKESRMMHLFNRGLRKVQKNGFYNRLRKKFSV